MALIIHLSASGRERPHRSRSAKFEDIPIGNQSLFEIDGQLERHARNATEKVFRKRAEELGLDAALRREGVSLMG